MYKLKLPEPQALSSPTSLDLDSDFHIPNTPKRRLSSMPEQLLVNVQDKEPLEAQFRPTKLVLTPVLRLQIIDASELSSSSSEESGPIHTSRCNSEMHSIVRRDSTFSSVLANNTPRRLTITEPQQSLMTEYTQRTAEMLADTQFRIRSFKAQRVMPQRYFKNI